MSPRRASKRHATVCGGGVDEEIRCAIEDTLGFGSITEKTYLGGSSWSSCHLFETASGKKLFAKTALGRSGKSMFDGESKGLQAMYETHALRIPEVYYVGDAPAGSFILMEYLNFEGAGKSSQALLGECLGRMHAATPQHPKAQEGYFGFDVDNTIGGTPQPNPWTKDWVAFFRDHRLRHQLSLAQDPTLSKLGDTLCNSLHLFFPPELQISPSILHGDLWSGNIATVDGMPSLYDPACYYGHSEAEFGMSWCAGFSTEFWDSYHSIMPRQSGFQERHQIYTLYHYLNHYNLFGGGYYSQCTQTLQRLISSIPK